MIAMLPKFDYLAPSTLQDTFELLESHGQEAVLLAGGTNLLVSLMDRELLPKYVIDIKRIKELNELSYHERRGLNVGAAVTMNRLIHHESSKNYPVLMEAIKTIGDSQVRNRATLVGNICNASPAADSAPALLVLDATLNIASRNNKRTIPLQEFFAGVNKTVLAKDELVTSINVPTPPERSVGGYEKARRTMGEDCALVGVAGLVARNEGAQKSVRLAYCSVAPTPVRASDSEGIFENAKSFEELLKQAILIAKRVIPPIPDDRTGKEYHRAGKEYRAALVETLTRRLLRRLWDAV